MADCFFVSDLHGHTDRYEKLFTRMIRDRPDAVFLGGDLLPPGGAVSGAAGEPTEGFIAGFLRSRLATLQRTLADTYPSIFVILGNDDPRVREKAVHDMDEHGLWHYVHARRRSFAPYSVYGYACVPPTPFQLKDWERYDVSRFVDPGSVSPEEGRRTVPVAARDARHQTMAKDLERLAADHDLAQAVFLFHAPPYRTNLDRAALDGVTVDHVPLDVHVGSIAIREFLESRQPLLALHGHIHESARLTGSWKDRLGQTWCLSAAHDGPELSLVRFDLRHLDQATRELI